MALPNPSLSTLEKFWIRWHMFDAADRLVLRGVWCECTVSIEKGRKLDTILFSYYTYSIYLNCSCFLPAYFTPFAENCTLLEHSESRM